MLKTYNGWFGNFSLNPEIDFYGDSYWEKISQKSYEPDTMVFLENNVGPLTDFIDVGAATGAMSLIAAKLGSRVQDFSSFFWTEEEINERLDKLMIDAFKGIGEVAQRHQVTLRTATFIVGCERILKARQMRGLYP